MASLHSSLLLATADMTYSTPSISFHPFNLYPNLKASWSVCPCFLIAANRLYQMLQHNDSSSNSIIHNQFSASVGFDSPITSSYHQRATELPPSDPLHFGQFQRAIQTISFPIHGHPTVRTQPPHSTLSPFVLPFFNSLHAPGFLGL